MIIELGSEASRTKLMDLCRIRQVISCDAQDVFAQLSPGDVKVLDPGDVKVFDPGDVKVLNPGDVKVLDTNT